MGNAFETIHNHCESAVYRTVLAMAPRYPLLRDNAELLADVACVALNKLPPRYIRHPADLAFFESDAQRKAATQAMDEVVNFAFGFVQARHAMRARC